jgi:hypothetical protein
VNDRPIRLLVSDDCRRSRLTVFFRLLLAIPHFFWLGVWALGIFISSIAQWAVTVVRGRGAQPLHNFHTGFVRYTAHVGAYLALAANPYPKFLGHPGYPIDLEIEPTQRQGRLGAFFRLLLAVPALFMMAVINGGGPASVGPYWLISGGAVAVAAFLGWFACLVLGRMPLGLRNLAAYGVRYTAEVYAYLLLLTPVYPSSNPTLPAEAAAPPLHPILLSVDDDRRRSRLTTFFRFFLLVPHLFWFLLWAVLALVASIGQWFFTLVVGRPATPLFRFLAAWARYQTHVFAFGFLIANPFPGFTGHPGYPVDLEIAPPERQKRLVTLFRLSLAIPAYVVSSALSALLYAAAIGGWFAALVLGRMPRGLRNAGAHALRYSAQVNAYVTFLTDRYPFSGPPIREAEPTAEAWPPSADAAT